MALTVEMLVDQRPGVLSRVIRALRDLEQTLESNTLGEHLETDFKVLTISSSGPSKRIAEVIERLQQVTGVIELTAIQGEAIPRAATAKEPLPFRLDSSAASLEEAVERIVTVYPRMLKELQAYEEQVPVEQAESQLTNLGRLVGEALAHQDSGLNSYQELEPAIDELLLPKITPFSRGHREQRRVVVPVSEHPAAGDADKDLRHRGAGLLLHDRADRGAIERLYRPPGGARHRSALPRPRRSHLRIQHRYLSVTPLRTLRPSVPPAAAPRRGGRVSGPP